MENKKGEWAVAYHGVSTPQNPAGSKKVMNSIMDGIDKGSMLRAGAGQAFENTYSLNKPKDYVGRGIYCSPHIQVGLGSYSSGLGISNKKYRLIFQCRVNPDAIKVCNNNIFWVLNDSKNIRPYGVILVKEENVSQIPTSAVAQFGEEFTWSKY